MSRRSLTSSPTRTVAVPQPPLCSRAHGGAPRAGRDDHARVLVQPAEEVEQQRSSGLTEGQVSQLVENDRVHARQACGDAPCVALRLFLLQRIDQVHDGVEAHALAVAGDAGHSKSRGQVALAGAGSADENNVVRSFGERHAGQLHHQLAIHRRDVEVEAGEVPMHRELGRSHLVAHRAHLAVGTLGLQQVFQQPARGVHRGVAALLDEIAPGAGHAVQAQVLEFGDELTHGRPPWRAGGHSSPYRPSASP